MDSLDKGFHYLSSESPDARSQVSGMPQGLDQQILRRTFQPNEQAARKQWAGVGLVQVPAYCLTYRSTATNQTFDVQLPDNINVLMFRALSTVEFYIGFAGQFNLASFATGQTSGDFVPLDACVCPLDIPFYVHGLRSVRLGIVANGVSVSVLGWTQLG